MVVRLDQVVAVGEIADAPHVGGLAVTLEDRLHAGVAQVGVGDYSVGEAGTVCCLLQPLGLRDRVGVAEGGLHVHRLGDVGVPGLGDVVLSDVVLLGEFPYFPPNDRMRLGGLPVAVHQLRVLHVVEVDMCVDELQLFHGGTSRVER